MFYLKGWAVTLVTAVLALSSNHSYTEFSLIAIIPLIVFWFLDAYYLQSERKYRELFKYIKKNDDLDFVMDLTEAKNIIEENQKTSYLA